MSAATTGRAPVVSDPMLDTVLATPEQWAQACALARGADLPTTAPRSVVVAGMGGSGIAGDVAALMGEERARVPVVAVHSEHLPRFVGADDLVVLVSHSGTTQETLACAEQAAARGARLVAVTSGGVLDEVTRGHGGAVVRVPADAPPRASVALLTVPVLAVLDATGVVAGALDACGSVADRLRALLGRWEPTDEERGEPLRLARALGDRVPLFLGSGALASVVAARARNQVAENAERPAHAEQLPEADHNQLVGWAGAGFAGGVDLVVLRGHEESPAERRRAQATIDLARAGFTAVHEHRLEAGDSVEQVAAGFLFVDLLSVHLARLAGIDPTPIAAIEELKRRL